MMKNTIFMLAMLTCMFASCSDGGSDSIPQLEEITLKEAGTLKSMLGEDYLNITSLKVVGPINGDDIYYLRKMLGGSDFSEVDKGKLATLDLSKASIVEGGGGYCYSLRQFAYDEELYTSDNIIGESMFHGCANLQNIVLPNNVISIDVSAFYFCESLKNITIPDGVTEIGSSAFSCCESLETITIPDGVTKISYEAFSSCSSLTSVTLPNGVTEIGSFAFTWCESLETITIPNSVTKIGSSAFSSCKSLETITIPNSVTEIGSFAFFNCSKLDVCYCYAEKVPELKYDRDYNQSTFEEIKEGATLYVPKRCGTKYRASDWGNYFYNIVEMD